MKLLKNNIYSKWKYKLSLTILGLIPIHIINTFPVKSNPVSEQIAYCKNYASSRIPSNDPKYLQNYEIVYNFCIKEIKKQILKLSYEKERGQLSPSERKDMKNTYCHGVEILGPSKMYYGGNDKPILPCGARVVIETESEIKIDNIQES